jgi:hypothetical protein
MSYEFSHLLAYSIWMGECCDKLGHVDLHRSRDLLAELFDAAKKKDELQYASARTSARMGEGRTKRPASRSPLGGHRHFTPQPASVKPTKRLEDCPAKALHG